jgi:hypothetical protein
MSFVAKVHFHILISMNPICWMVKSSIWLQALPYGIPYHTRYLAQITNSYLVVNLIFNIDPTVQWFYIDKNDHKSIIFQPRTWKKPWCLIYLGDFRGYSPKRGSSLIQGCLAKVVPTILTCRCPPLLAPHLQHCTSGAAAPRQGCRCSGTQQGQGVQRKFVEPPGGYWLVNSYPGIMVFCNFAICKPDNPHNNQSMTLSTMEFLMDRCG